MRSCSTDRGAALRLTAGSFRAAGAKELVLARISGGAGNLKADEGLDAILSTLVKASPGVKGSNRGTRLSPLGRVILRRLASVRRAVGAAAARRWTGVVPFRLDRTCAPAAGRR